MEQDPQGGEAFSVRLHWPVDEQSDEAPADVPNAARRALDQSAHDAVVTTDPLQTVLRAFASSIDTLARSTVNAQAATDAKLVQLAAGVDELTSRAVARLDDDRVALGAVLSELDRTLEEMAAANAAGFEEVREHVAAAFDWVRSLADQVTGVAEGQAALAATLGGLSAQLAALDERQVAVHDQLARLADEVRAYRRRTTLHARPAPLTDEQLASVTLEVVRVVRADLASGEPGPPPESSPPPPPPPPPAAPRRGRRRSPR